MARVTFVLPGGRSSAVDVAPGSTLLEAAREGGVAIEGACGGSMACATCHVHVDRDWFARLPPASADEEDMLDLAQELARTSRLGCQIRVTSALEGITVAVPASTLLDD